MSIEQSLKKALELASTDDDVLAAFIFGSYVWSESHQDIDLCLVIWPTKTALLNELQKEIVYSEPELDIHLFHNLPIYIQTKILEEGVLKLVKDEDELHTLIRIILQDWEDFRPRYEMHLESVLHGSENSH